MEELELTYLLKELPADLRQAPCKELLDIYLPASAKHPTLRIRQSGEKYEITKKQPIENGDSSRQLETTIPLTAEEFADLDQLPGKRVKKTRYYYKHNGQTFEIGVFRESLAGLILIDVEFATVAEKSAFVPPPFCLAEVTQEEFTAGGMLCGKSYSDIEEKLNKFGYKKTLIDF